MTSSFKKALFTVWLCWSAVSIGTSQGVKISDDSGSDIIETDVLIAGGGSAGTYAALKLHDLGKKFVIIERESYIGGHTHSWQDPQTNQSIDYGVEAFRDLDVARSYFKRLDIPFHKLDPWADTVTKDVDMKTGHSFYNNDSVGYLPPGMDEFENLARQYTYLEKGFYIPDPVPEDLLMPLGDYLVKHNLTSIVWLMSEEYIDVLPTPMLYVLGYFGPDMINNLRTGFLQTTRKHNYEIYEKAYQILKPNVLLNSQIFSVNRTHDNYQIVHVQTPTGLKIIKSKRVLVAHPQTLDNMMMYDLDSTEEGIFKSFRSKGMHACLVRNLGLGLDLKVLNKDPNRLYHLPRVPSILKIQSTHVPDLFVIHYLSHSDLKDEVVKSDILSSLKTLQATGYATSEAEPEIVAYTTHAPYHLTVSTEDIKSGFYKRLYGLQGRHNTFYTGAAFYAHDSALIWRFTDELIPRILEGIE